MKYESEIQRYRMVYDHHTHTTYSHGTGSIMDNVRVAWEKGLESVAITDHGPSHLTYGLKVNSIAQMREDIAEAKRKYSGIQVLLGVEANTLRIEPYIDVPRDDRDHFDLVNAGYHFGMLHADMIPNWWYKHLGKGKGTEDNSSMAGTDLMVKNTAMILNCLYHNEEAGNHIEILTHPGDKGPFDIEDIARACQDTGTLLEINGKHPHLTVEELKIAKRFDVKFVISSDAHVPEKVGTFEPQLLRALEAGVEPERIVNIALK